MNAHLIWPGKSTTEHDAAGESAGNAAGGKPQLAVTARYRAQEHHHDANWCNQLAFCDNLLAMNAWARELAGKIDLIYIDPPFGTGTNWHGRRAIAEGACDQRRTYIKQEGFKDTWKGLDSYLDMIWPRLVKMRELLSERGSLFVHVGWQANSYLRLLLDELFGPDKLVNEIVWHYQTSSGSPKAALIKNHATIWHYAKGESWTFNDLREPWPESTLKKWQTDSQGRRYRAQHKFNKRYYVDPLGKRLDDVWDITLASRSYERTSYPTQKPQALLERIILLASAPGDLVADFFCGSGTTLSAAHKLGRRWIGCDSGDAAVATTRRRLLQAAANFDLLQASGASGALPPQDRIQVDQKLSAPQGTPTSVIGSTVNWDHEPKFTFFKGRKPVSSQAQSGLKERPQLAATLTKLDSRTVVVTLTGLAYQDRESWPASLVESLTDWDQALYEWAVDWSYDGATFCPDFWAFRTSRNQTLSLTSSAHRYQEPGKYRLRLQVLDLFGTATELELECQVD